MEIGMNKLTQKMASYTQSLEHFNEVSDDILIENTESRPVIENMSKRMDDIERLNVIMQRKQGTAGEKITKLQWFDERQISCSQK